MIYTNKRNEKIIRRMRKVVDKQDPQSRQEKILARNLSVFSRGGERERSHRKIVGNIVRKNMDEKLNAIEKAHKRLENILYKKQKNAGRY